MTCTRTPTVLNMTSTCSRSSLSAISYGGDGKQGPEHQQQVRSCRPVNRHGRGFDRVESIVAHEYPNWTGNRVTSTGSLTWEGRTVYRDQCNTADMHDDGFQRAGDVSLLRAAQFPEDSSPTAHPIRPESYSEINNFYTPTVYEKGAEVIRMMAGYLGRDGFRRGMDLYFERHDGQAVTCDDFVAAMADANGRDMSAFHGWYSQAGTPRLEVRRSVDEGGVTLTFSQDIPETAAGTPRDPLAIPVRLGFVGAAGAPVRLRLEGENEARDEHVILFEGAEASYRFLAEDRAGMPSQVTPSLLRGFSAPVRLQDDLEPGERLRLVAHDSDLFNRWDSAQLLATDAILARAAGEHASVEALASGFGTLLADDSLLDDFKAGALRLPGQAVLEAAGSPADPVALFVARRGIMAALGTALAPQIAAALGAREEMAGSAGGRALLMQFVELGVAAGDTGSVQSAESMVLDPNMTISQGALKALIHCDDAARERALAAFHDRWAGNALVMEKWFQMESMSSVGGSIDRLDELMRHPEFDPKNPNKLRAVLGAFMMGNTPRFHAADGSGYDYMADRLVEIDSRNPQIAARMALPMTRMSAYGARQGDARP